MPEELSKLLEVDVNYKPSKKVNNTKVSKKEQVHSVLQSTLSQYVVDGSELDSLIASLYTELAPIFRKTK